MKALDAAKRRATAILKQKDDVEQQLHDALARLAEERGRRASLEKALAKESKPRSAPTFSFVRDWLLLGPFASTPEQGHDAVYPPEREPVQLKKAYDGFGGPLNWRPYRGTEDKIDLAGFFKYHKAGAAYAVSWVYSDGDQTVTLGVGSDDGIRLWVNGEKVHDVKGGRQARPGQDVVKARLKKGWNEIRAQGGQHRGHMGILPGIPHLGRRTAAEAVLHQLAAPSDGEMNGAPPCAPWTTPERCQNDRKPDRGSPYPALGLSS